MAVSTEVSVEPIIDEIVLDAYKKAGLIPITFAIGNDSEWVAKSAHGRRTMTRIINGLAVHGFLDYFVDFCDLELTQGEPFYCLDDNVLNVVGDASYIPASNLDTTITDGEIQVSSISARRWNSLSGKSAEGTPSLMYVHRQGKTVSIRLWPLPSENGVIRLRVHRIPYSSQDGSKNADLRRYWEDYLVHAISAQLMADSKMPLDEIGFMERKARSMLTEIKNYAVQNEPPVVISMHSTPYRRN